MQQVGLGRYSWPGRAAWALLGGGLLSLTIGLKFVLLDGSMALAALPMALTVVGLAGFALIASKAGRVVLSDGEITVQPLIGHSRTRVRLTQLVNITIEQRTLTLQPEHGEPIELKRVDPDELAGLIWFAWYYRDRVMTQLFENILGAPLWQGKSIRAARRAFVDCGQERFFDRGLLVPCGKSLVYLPTSDVGDRPNQLAEGVSPLLQRQDLMPAHVPPVSELPIARFVESLFAFENTESNRSAVLDELIANHLGVRLDGVPDRQNVLWGTVGTYRVKVTVDATRKPILESSTGLTRRTRESTPAPRHRAAHSALPELARIRI